ncbi:Crp/Fnr family transcriptional regulator [Luteolibacter sp. AS25]|uniref:Crp/Fnr family transcriptional regulator n=1 Tax=Luteolibacter sp. AS25 TaxID=3135776 RepID=UPI00398B6F53
METFGAGDLVIAEGRRAGALYFLKSGTIKIYRCGVVTATISEPGTVIGEVSILLDRPHIAEVRAVDECTFHVAADAAAFLREHPNVNLFICRELAKKVDALSCYLADLKAQYGDEDTHMGMMHEVLDTLMHNK